MSQKVRQKANEIFGTQLEWCRKLYKKDGISPPGYYIKLTSEEHPRWFGNNVSVAIEALKQIADDYITASGHRN